MKSLAWSIQREICKTALHHMRTGKILRNILCFLKAQLLCDYINITDSLTHGTFDFSAIFPLFVDRFGRSLRVFHLEFDKEAISDNCRSKNARYRWGIQILSDFSELSFCGPFGLC